VMGFPRRRDILLPSRGVYVNSAFTSLTPRVVVDAIQEYYSEYRGSPTGRNEVVNDRIALAYGVFRGYFGATSSDGMVFTKRSSRSTSIFRSTLIGPTSSRIIQGQIRHTLGYQAFRQSSPINC
jgi:selenocysteine lyase/cysteine desulfurase